MMSGNRNGYIMETAPIAVDYWRATQNPNSARFFFLTHCHADHTKGLSATWRRPIYCSSISAKLASHLFDLPAEIFKIIDPNQTLSLDFTDDDGEIRSFHVTALDANHCPGAVMYLFEGSFGRILSTGDFRFENLHEFEMEVLKSRPLDFLFLDATNWTTSPPNFPHRKDVETEVLKLIKSRPANEVIILAMPQVRLGKEHLLKAIALELREKICVPTKRLAILKVLGEDEFCTDDISESRIHLIGGDIHNILQKCREFKKKKRPVYLCILTSLARWRGIVTDINSPVFGRSSAFVYSDHSSREELEHFLDPLTVQKIQLVGCKDQNFLTGDEKIRFETRDLDTLPETEISPKNRPCNAESALRMISASTGDSAMPKRKGKNSIPDTENIFSNEKLAALSWRWLLRGQISHHDSSVRNDLSTADEKIIIARNEDDVENLKIVFDL